MTKQQKIKYYNEIKKALLKVNPNLFNGVDTDAVNTMVAQYITDHHIEQVLNLSINSTTSSKTVTGMEEADVNTAIDNKFNSLTPLTYPPARVTNYVNVVNATADVSNQTEWRLDKTIDTVNYIDDILISINGDLALATYADKIVLHFLNEDRTPIQFSPDGSTISKIVSSIDLKRSIVKTSNDTFEITLNDNNEFSKRKIDPYVGSYITYSGHTAGIINPIGTVAYGRSNFKYQLGFDNNWSRIENHTLFDYIANNEVVSTPDLKLIWQHYPANDQTKISFTSYADDGTKTLSDLMIRDLDHPLYRTENIDITADKMKMVIFGKDVVDGNGNATGNNKFHTYYKQEDGTWAYQYSNTNGDNNLRRTGKMSHDGKIYIAQITDKMLVYKQKGVVILNANSNDPFNDGSLKYFFKFNDDTVDSIAGNNLVQTEVKDESNTNIAVAPEYEAVKFDNGIKLLTGNQNNSVELKNDAVAISSGISISFFTDIDNSNNDANYITFGSNYSINISILDTNVYVSLIGSGDQHLNEPIKGDNNVGEYHIAVVQDGISVKGYLNGALVVSATTDIEPDFVNTVKIGNVNNSKTVHVDHVQVFDRALTDDEIYQLSTARI